jgi:DNA polymerase (family 10)
VRGFGPRTEERLLDAIARLREGQGRVLLHRATEAGRELVEHMRSARGVSRAEVGGELRRLCETVSILPLVVAGEGVEAAEERLSSFPLVEAVAAPGPEQRVVVLTNGLPVVLFFAAAEAYGTALVRSTGSLAHCARLDAAARARGLDRGFDEIRTADEAVVYARLGLPFIPPELREDEGEIEAALGGLLPRPLVALPDVAGMVHCHTTYSDGRASVRQMAEGAKRRGMSYITITDHSPSAS